MHRTGPEEDCKVFSKQACLMQKGGPRAFTVGEALGQAPSCGVGEGDGGGGGGWGGGRRG